MDKIKITKEDLTIYKSILEKEQEILNRIISTNEDISKVYYNENLIIIQFQSGKKLNSKYLEELQDIIEYKMYEIETVTVTKQFFRIKYDEQVLQMNIHL